MLKNEVAQLKQLLLTHKDCPITAMQKESQGYLSKSPTFLLFFSVQFFFATKFALNLIERAKVKCRLYFQADIQEFLSGFQTILPRGSLFPDPCATPCPPPPDHFWLFLPWHFEVLKKIPNSNFAASKKRASWSPSTSGPASPSEICGLGPRPWVNYIQCLQKHCMLLTGLKASDWPQLINM